MKQYPSILDIPIGERIETLQQLRLITNTKAEWDDLYGRLKINQRKPKKEDNRIDETSEQRELGRYQFIYDSLTTLFNEVYKMNLDDFLQDYLFSSKKYCGEMQNLSRNKIEGESLWSPRLIEFFLTEKFKQNNDEIEIAGWRRSAIDTLSKMNPALLLCWVHGWLPAYGSKVGDIEMTKNREHLIEAYQVMRKMFTPQFSTPFAIFEKEYKMLREIDDLNQMDVYIYVAAALDRLYCLYNPSGMHDISYNSEYVYIEEICTEKNVAWKDADSNDIWTFNICDSGYIFMQYKRGGKKGNHDSQEKHYVRYEGCIVKEKDKLQLIIRFPKSIEYILKNEQMPPEILRKAPILLEDDEKTNRINSIDILLEDNEAGTLEGLPHRLERVNYHFYEKELNAYTNLYPKYQYTSPDNMVYVERMISNDFMFIARSRKKVGNRTEITSWYRIPIASPQYEDIFNNIPLDESICLISYQDETYILFIHYVLSLQVTTIENCNDNNIAIVKYPTPITFDNEVIALKVLATSMKRTGDHGIHIHSTVEIWHLGDDVEKDGTVIEVDEDCENLPSIR